MAKGRGGGKTPEKVVQLINKAIANKGQSVLEQETGLSHSMISRYKRGVGEPSTSTLQILADYFGVSIWELRGDVSSNDVNIDQIRLMHNLQSMLKGFLEYKEEIPGWLADGFRDVAETFSATQITGEGAVADVTKEVKKTAEVVLKKICKKGKR